MIYAMIALEILNLCLNSYVAVFLF